MKKVKIMKNHNFSEILAKMLTVQYEILKNWAQFV